MGLSEVLARSAARQAHALVVEVPGSWRIRAAVERAVLERGWSLALSPADADVLVVCGKPGEELAGALEVVWRQMPGPRVRTEVHGYDDVAGCLEETHARLLDEAHHRHDALHRPAGPDLLTEQSDHGEMDHGEMDHGEMDHGEMDHGDMDMSPSGIPLAEGGEDRDGLEMDVLRVRLGPVLPYWPAGLVMHCSLQGDVIVEAHAELLDADASHDGDTSAPARSVDNLVSLLALAGWDDAAAEARRIRDRYLAQDGAEAVARLARLSRKVRRSWVLRRSLRGVRRVGEDELREFGLPASAAGDTYDRLVAMLDRAVTGMDGDAGRSGEGRFDHRTGTPVGSFEPDHLAHLVTGLDLATARLVVAGLDVREIRTGQAAPEVRHG